MSCYYCSQQRYDLCKNLCIHKLRNCDISDVIDDEIACFMKDNLIYKNNINEIIVYDEILNDKAKNYIQCKEFTHKLKDMMINYAPKNYKNEFLKHCYNNLINDNISETIEYYCYHMDNDNKQKIAYYMLATALIINKLQLM